MSKYWSSIEDLENVSKTDKEAEPEFSVTGISEDEIKGNFTTSRRDFLKTLGFGIGFVALAGCETPINKAIPFFNKPEEIIPGVANYYASTFFDGNDYCSILVKTREGRPIKIEGNDKSNVSLGGTNARVQASVLELYDSNKIKSPLKSNAKSTWAAIDKDIMTKLDEFAKKNEKVVILTSSIISPSTKNIFNNFIKKYPATEIVIYDAISHSGMLEANKLVFDVQALPTYKFDKADLIVSFGADFLGTWISPIEFTKQFATKRKLKKDKATLSKFVQFESTLSLTGSNADFRIPINPSQEGIVILNLYNKIAQKAGKNTIKVEESKINIDTLADELWSNKGRCLVIAGSNDVNIQIVVNKINEYLENYGTTIDLENPTYFKQGIDSEMDKLIERMGKGEIAGIFLNNVNPAYDYPKPEAFTEALAKTKLSVSFSDVLDETTKSVAYVCPDSNYLESWNDAEPRKNSFSLAQPVIPKLFDTRQMQESFLTWIVGTPAEAPKNATETPKNLADKDNPYYLYIKKYWEENLFKKQTEFSTFNTFWNNSLQVGVFTTPDADKQKEKPKVVLADNDVEKIASTITAYKFSGFEFTLFENIGIGAGKHANNPWLQELPDPVSKVCWDNYLAIPLSLAKKFDLKLGDKLIVNNLFELPVLIQPGQADNTISIALGYGRSSCGKVGDHVGQNAFQLINSQKNRLYSGSGLSIIPTGTNYIFALTQTYHTMMGRDHVHHSHLEEYKKNFAAGNEAHVEKSSKKVTLYKQREFKGHHWGLAIDLNACTGCSACVIACQAENNVAVIGRDEVRNRRIMHWIRIDRYYSEQPENPEVYFQPVMCQHCNSAPCENVCPVEATQNSKEGLNEMAYNRCIGTRYCMNNCPYRVRRFNWFEFNNNTKFDYNMNSSLGKMVLNPDVVVRTRGVVEKCSFCAQRIQEGKLNAKKENRELADGEIKPACLQACPAAAMIFGDRNMPDSAISKAFADERRYHLLEELNTSPAVAYMTKINNDKA